MSRIRAADTTFRSTDYLDDAAYIQPLLRKAREQVGHALCLCTTPARQLVIREVREHLYLAVWPEDGHWHHPSCVFHRDEDALPGVTAAASRGSRTEHVPAANLNGDGRWVVLLDLPMPPSTGGTSTQGSKNRPAQAIECQRATVPVGPRRADRQQKIPLQSMMRWLWDSTALNRWQPEKPVSWPRVMHLMRQSAHAVVVNGHSLENCLYLPPPYSRDRRTELVKMWGDFTASLGHGDARGFVLGEVKSIMPSEYGHSVRLKNLPGTIFMQDHVHAQLSKHHLAALAVLGRESFESTRVMSLLAIENTARGNHRVVDMAVILASKDYIPCSNAAEVSLANEMASAGRAFTKGVGGSSADFVLDDTEPATPMLVFQTTSSENMRREETFRREVQEDGRSLWCWHPGSGQKMPDLPPPQNQP